MKEKVPLTYLKIPDTSGCPLKKCWAFEKYDGTNMHWDYDHGFKSFGTRRDSFPYSEEGFKEFADAHPGLERAPEVFKEFESFLSDVLFTNHSGAKFTVFTEYLGPFSFAGQHKPGDLMTHIIIDVMKGNKFLPPEKFIDLFHSDWAMENGAKFLRTANLVYQGKYSGQLVDDVRNGKFPVKEGVVIKGVHYKEVEMFKVKTNAYMQRLQEEFKDNWKDYWE